MAEFQEVMRQAQRMCEYRRKCGLKCHDCDAVHICGLEIRHVGLDTLCADADAVMAWAEKHPELVYPTWAEWLGHKVSGVDADSIYEAWHVLCTTPIPADIAEKLGIEPKENI